MGSWNPRLQAGEDVNVDIALLSEFRRTGIGSGLVRRLLDQADASHLPIRCHVLHASTARRFWERAGFAAQGRDGVYLAMERAPRPCHPDRGGAVRPCSPQHGPAGYRRTVAARRRIERASSVTSMRPGLHTT